jgi:uncharacterized membrane protein YhaH (DUF805 family)
MELVNYYVAVLKKYAEFSGRARRKEFWMFYLANVIISAVLGGLSRLGGVGILFSIISGLYSLAVLVPGLALSVRRLHDTNRRWVSLLFGLIPLVGVILLIVFFAEDSAPGDNEFGPNPKTLPEPSVEQA